MYHNGTTDRSYTINNRQVAHKYGSITLVADNGETHTESFKDFYQQTELEKKFRKLRTEKYNGKAEVYLTFDTRMNTRKATAFADYVAVEVGFRFPEDEKPTDKHFTLDTDELKVAS